MSFNCETDADKSFEFENTQYSNSKFIFEKQVNDQISFLEVVVTNYWDKFFTSVFRKKTVTGLFTSHLDFTAFSYIVEFVRILLHRVNFNFVNFIVTI